MATRSLDLAEVLDTVENWRVRALPAEALAAYAELRVLLETAPWHGRPYSRNKPDGALRVQPFATFGHVVYLVLEDRRQVDILMVQWAG